MAKKKREKISKEERELQRINAERVKKVAAGGVRGAKRYQTDRAEYSTLLTKNAYTSPFDEGRKKKHGCVKRFFINLLTVILGIVAVASALTLIYTGKNEYEMRKVQRNLAPLYDRMVETTVTTEDGVTKSERNPTDYRYDFDALLEMNPDTVGWIRIKNTSVSYPLVQATWEKTASWWLFKDFFGNYSLTGCIVLDEHMNTSSMSMLISGHRTQFANEMFNDLAWNHEQDRFDGMGALQLTTLDGQTRSFEPLCASDRGDTWAPAQRYEFETFEDLRTWLAEVYADADAKTYESKAERLISSAKQVIVTYCCTSIYYSEDHRVYTFWVCDTEPSEELNALNGSNIWTTTPDHVVTTADE